MAKWMTARRPSSSSPGRPTEAASRSGGRPRCGARVGGHQRRPAVRLAELAPSAGPGQSGRLPLPRRSAIGAPPASPAPGGPRHPRRGPALGGARAVPALASLSRRQREVVTLVAPTSGASARQPVSSDCALRRCRPTSSAAWAGYDTPWEQKTMNDIEKRLRALFDQIAASNRRRGADPIVACSGAPLQTALGADGCCAHPRVAALVVGWWRSRTTRRPGSPSRRFGDAFRHYEFHRGSGRHHPCPGSGTLASTTSSTMSQGSTTLPVDLLGFFAEPQPVDLLLSRVSVRLPSPRCCTCTSACGARFPELLEYHTVTATHRTSTSSGVSNRASSAPTPKRRPVDSAIWGHPRGTSRATRHLG